jgi:hypothetical protein
MQFLMIFDCTPPQPWTADEAHWIGAVDVSVRRIPNGNAK